MTQQKADPELTKLLELTKRITDQKRREVASELLQRARKSIRDKQEFVFKGTFSGDPVKANF